MTFEKPLMLGYAENFLFSYNQELWKFKIYNIADKDKKEQKQIVPENSKTLDFQILRVLTKVGYHYKITGNPEKPV